jgi:hypothetical protein
MALFNVGFVLGSSKMHRAVDAYYSGYIKPCDPKTQICFEAPPTPGFMIEIDAGIECKDLGGNLAKCSLAPKKKPAKGSYGIPESWVIEHGKLTCNEGCYADVASLLPHSAILVACEDSVGCDWTMKGESGTPIGSGSMDKPSGDKAKVGTCLWEREDGTRFTDNCWGHAAKLIDNGSLAPGAAKLICDPRLATFCSPSGF